MNATLATFTSVKSQKITTLEVYKGSNFRERRYHNLHILWCHQLPALQFVLQCINALAPKRQSTTKKLVLFKIIFLGSFDIHQQI